MLLPGHTNYVQGVAWDPLNTMVVTQSADRSCRAHMLKTRPGAMIKLAPRGHVTARMHQVPSLYTYTYIYIHIYVYAYIHINVYAYILPMVLHFD